MCLYKRLCVSMYLFVLTVISVHAFQVKILIPVGANLITQQFVVFLAEAVG